MAATFHSSWVSHKHSAKQFHSITCINYLDSPLQGCGLLFYAKCAVIKFDISTWIKYVVWWAKGRWLFLLAIWRIQPDNASRAQDGGYKSFLFILLFSVVSVINAAQVN